MCLVQADITYIHMACLLCHRACGFVFVKLLLRRWTRLLPSPPPPSRIRASIAQFQQELIGHVREAVSAIQDKFRHRYEVRSHRLSSCIVYGTD